MASSAFAASASLRFRFRVRRPSRVRTGRFGATTVPSSGDTYVSERSGSGRASSLMIVDAFSISFDGSFASRLPVGLNTPHWLQYRSMSLQPAPQELHGTSCPEEPAMKVRSVPIDLRCDDGGGREFRQSGDTGPLPRHIPVVLQNELIGLAVLELRDPSNEGEDARAVHEVEVANVELDPLQRTLASLLVDGRPVRIEDVTGLAHLHGPGHDHAHHAVGTDFRND